MKKAIIIGAAAVAFSVMGVQAEDGGDHWSDSISLKGDLRTRFETIDDSGKSETRNRWRIRARLSMDAEVNEMVDVKARLVSGGDDPVSSNQTLDGGFSTKDFRLDRFYFDLHPEDYIDGLNILGGKMGMPFETVKDLIWDGDLSLEGFAAQYAAGDAIKFIANAGVFFAEERSSDDDTSLYGVQAAIDADLDGASLLIGASAYIWDNMEGFEPLVESDDGFGNDLAVTATDPATGDPTAFAYANDFTEYELFAKLKLDLGIPVAVYGDYVVNDDADSEDTGVMVGVTLGKAKDPGSLQFDYNYRDLEANAVVGAFTDSDSFGGGTGGDGHKVQAKYQLAKNWQFAVSWFMQEKASGDDFDRGQFDLIAKF